MKSLRTPLFLHERAVIWDAFMFRNEIDMLEARLTYFDKYLDVWHVLVESSLTHRGEPKPLYFADNRDRFAQWEDRLVHLICDLTAGGSSAWAREHFQRDFAQRGMSPASDDVVLISDVDEFPSAAFMTSGLPNAGTPRVTLNQALSMYAVDWVMPDEWPCQVAVTGASLAGHSLSSIRDNRLSYPSFSGGGRHLTWLGGQEEQRVKLAVTCHEEMRPDERERLASGECYRTGIHHPGDLYLHPVDVDETWPEYIYDRKCPESWFRPR